MIASAPGWLQPLLWIAVIAIVGAVIVLLWHKLAPSIERWEVRGMREHGRHWTRRMLTLSFIALIALVVAIVSVLR